MGIAALLQKASGTSQIIVSTQSVELVNLFEAEDIITVDREEEQSVFKRLSSASRGVEASLLNTTNEPPQIIEMTHLF